MGRFLRHRFISFLVLLWTIPGLHLAALPMALSVAQVEACIDACSKREPCCCERLGLHCDMACSTGREPVGSPDGTGLERQLSLSSGSGTVDGGGRLVFSLRPMALTSASFVPAAEQPRLDDESHDARPDLEIPVTLPRPPPSSSLSV